MKQFKRAEVILLPSKEMLDAYKAPITKVYEDNGKLYLNPKERGEFITELGSPQHLHFTSDEKIKEGDWFLNSKTNAIGQYNGSKILLFKGDKKIISSTDESLKFIKHDETVPYPKGVQISLSKPSLNFIEKYIECYNKGEIITDVLVEYESQSYSNRFEDGKSIINPDTWGRMLKLKVNPKDNTITIRKVKDSLLDIVKKDSGLKKELIQLLVDCCGEVSCEDGILLGKEPADLFKWIDNKIGI